MQLGFFFDQSKCTGCSICVIACKDWNGVPVGPANWLSVNRVMTRTHPPVFVSAMIRPCYHCAMPPCVGGCPVGAITKRMSDGLVMVDRSACLGLGRCDMCLQACPYGSPQFSPGRQAKMEKCDFYAARLAQGKSPICVAVCPVRAIEYGPLDELKAKYGAGSEAEGLKFEESAVPSIVVRAKTQKATTPVVDSCQSPGDERQGAPRAT